MFPSFSFEADRTLNSTHPLPDWKLHSNQSALAFVKSRLLLRRSTKFFVPCSNILYIRLPTDFFLFTRLSKESTGSSDDDLQCRSSLSTHIMTGELRCRLLLIPITDRTQRVSLIIARIKHPTVLFRPTVSLEQRASNADMVFLLRRVNR